MEKLKNKILFIINPISGNGKGASLPALIKKHLNFQLFDPSFSFTKYAGHAHEIALKSDQLNYKAIIVVGGDGTFNEVASAIIGTNLWVGLIPIGSGNGMARHLKIPINSVSAIKRLNDFSFKTIDTGMVNNKSFIGVFGLGFDALVADKFSKVKKRGLFTYLKIIANEFLKYQPFHYSISIDKLNINQEAFIVCIANSSQYGNNAIISPNSDVNDGKFNLIIIKKIPLWALPKFIFYLLNHSVSKSKYFTEYVGENFEIIHHHAIAHIDGEPIPINKKINITVNPSSLKVLC